MPEQPSQIAIIFGPIVAGRAYIVKYKRTLRRDMDTGFRAEPERTGINPNITETRFYQVTIELP